MNFLEKSKQNLEEYRNILNERETDKITKYMIAAAQLPKDIKSKLEPNENITFEADGPVKAAIDGGEKGKLKTVAKRKARKSTALNNNIKNIKSKKGKVTSDDILEANTEDFVIDEISYNAEDENKSSLVWDENDKNKDNETSIDTNGLMPVDEDTENIYNCKEASGDADATKAQEVVQSLVLCDLFNNSQLKKSNVLKIHLNDKKEKFIGLNIDAVSEYLKYSKDNTLKEFADNKLKLKKWGNAILSLYNIVPRSVEAERYLSNLKKEKYQVIYPNATNLGERSELENILYGDGISSKDSYIPADVYFVKEEFIKNFKKDNFNDIASKEGRKNKSYKVVDTINTWFKEDNVIPISLKKVEIKNNKGAELHYVRNSDISDATHRDKILNAELVKILDIVPPNVDFVRNQYTTAIKKSSERNEQPMLELLRKIKGKQDRANFIKSIYDDSIKAIFENANDDNWESIIKAPENSEKLIALVKSKLPGLEKESDIVNLCGNTYIKIRIPKSSESEIYHHFDKFAQNDNVVLSLEFRAKDYVVYVDESGTFLIKGNEWQCNAMIEGATEAILGGGLKDQLKKVLAKCSFSMNGMENEFNKQSQEKLLTFQAAALKESDFSDNFLTTEAKEGLKSLCRRFQEYNNDKGNFEFSGDNSKGDSLTVNSQFKTSSYQGLIGALSFLYTLSKLSKEKIDGGPSEQQIFFRDVILKSYKLDPEVQDTLKIY